MNAYVYWVCGFKMSENQQKVSKSGGNVFLPQQAFPFIFLSFSLTP